MMGGADFVNVGEHDWFSVTKAISLELAHALIFTGIGKKSQSEIIAGARRVSVY